MYLYAYTFPTTVANALSHIQSFTYDYKTGQILTSTDPNGQVTETIYDNFGRILKIIGPNDTESSPGIEYSYDLGARPVKITTLTKVDAGESATSYAFLDGLGRTIEVKTEAEDTSQQIISGIVKFDSRGQVKEKYLPYFAAKSDAYLPPNYAQRKVIYVYDAMGRAVQTVRPDGAVNYVKYNGWSVTTIDENGNKLTEYKLDSLPVFDGMAAASERLYISTIDGNVLCLEGR